MNCHIYFSRCNKHIRSLATFNFFATIFLRFSTDVWLSTLTEKQPPVVVFTLSVICDKLNSVPHPMCCWISCESLPIFLCVFCVTFVFQKLNQFQCSFAIFGFRGRLLRLSGIFNSEWWLWDLRTVKLLCAPMLPLLLLLLFLFLLFFFRFTQYAIRACIYLLHFWCVHYTLTDSVCVRVYFYRLFVCVGPKNYHTIHRVAIVFRAAVTLATNTRNTVHARVSISVCVRKNRSECEKTRWCKKFTHAKTMPSTTTTKEIFEKSTKEKNEFTLHPM